MDDDETYDGPYADDLDHLAAELNEPPRVNALRIHTLQDAITHATEKHLEPFMGGSGRWIGLNCPICATLGKKSAATIIDEGAGLLVAECPRCNNNVDPGIMLELGRVSVSHNGNGTVPGSVVRIHAERGTVDPIDFGWTDSITPGEPSRGHGLLYAPPHLSRRVVVYGDGETYKTFLVLGLVLDVIRCEQRKVVWLDYEAVGRPELISRMLDIGAERDELEGWFGTYNPDEGMNGFAAYVATHNPAVVVFDAWIGLAHAEGFISQKDADDAEAIWGSAMTHLGAPGRTLLAIDHLNRDKTDWARPGGSIRKRNAVDQAWCAYHAETEPSTNPERIAKKLPGRAVITLRRSKGRLFIYPPGQPELSAPVPPSVELTLDFDHQRVSVITRDQFTAKTEAQTKPVFRPTHLMERASIILEGRATPASMNILEKDIGGKRDFARIAVDRLVEEGFAVEQKGSNRTRLIEHIRPYREAADQTSDKFAPSSPPVRPGEPENGFAPVRPTYVVGGESGGRTQHATDDDQIPGFAPGEPEDDQPTYDDRG